MHDVAVWGSVGGDAATGSEESKALKQKDLYYLPLAFNLRASKPQRTIMLSFFNHQTHLLSNFE